MRVKLDQEAHQLLEGIVTDIQAREERMNRLKKVKKDIADILEDREGAARQFAN
jgi:predicted ATPase with chaperone activity